MNFYKNNIKTILSKVNIKDVIGLHLELKKKGNKFYSLCPFHKEKNPSFYISESRQIFYCFGCGVNGNVINFIMNYKCINFIESIKYISSVVKINIISNKNTKILDFYKIMNDISLYYSNILKTEINKNFNLNEFIKKRTLLSNTLCHFDIGYSNNNIVKLFRKFSSYKNFKKKLLFCDIISYGKYNLYEKFFNRIIFPIKNESGNIVGFGGRSLNSKKNPKYLNSSDSIFFKKGNELYGLYELKKNSNLKFKSVIVVEGYIDVISLYQYGIMNVVAILGTALTEKQLFKLKNNFDEIIFCYDGDDPGYEAIWRSIKFCLANLNDLINIKIMCLPTGYDPDSFVRKYGKFHFLRKLFEAINIVDYIYRKLSYGLDIKNLDCKIVFLKKIMDFQKKVKCILYKNLIWSHSFKLVGIENIELEKYNYFYNCIDFINYLTNENKNYSSPYLKGIILLYKYNFLLKYIEKKHIIKNKNDFYFSLFINYINSLNNNTENFKISEKLSLNFNIEDKDKIKVKKEFIDILNRINNDNKNLT